MSRPNPMRPPPPETLPPDHIGILIAAVMLMAIGWLGLYPLVMTSKPYVGQRLLFFILLHIATIGTVIPFVRYLNVRLTPLNVDLAPGGVIVRQSTWIGLFIGACAWLQLLRVLNIPVALFVGLAFTIIEVFLRSREIQNERED